MKRLYLDESYMYRWVLSTCSHCHHTDDLICGRFTIMAGWTCSRYLEHKWFDSPFLFCYKCMKLNCMQNISQCRASVTQTNLYNIIKLKITRSAEWWGEKKLKTSGSSHFATPLGSPDDAIIWLNGTEDKMTLSFFVYCELATSAALECGAAERD